MKNILTSLVLSFCFIYLQSCRDKNVSGKSDKELIADSSSEISEKPAENKPEVVRKISYTIAELNDSIRKAIKDSLSKDQLEILLALNRTDRSSWHRLKKISIPDTFVADFNVYSPFPDSLHLLDSVNKIFLVSYPIQAFAAYDSGQLKRWGPTSMGKQSTPTPTGLYFTNWKKKETISTEDSTWILKWYFNFDNSRGISFHEYELPGFPASHSCVRLREEDAEWIYHWADQWKLDSTGTNVVTEGTPLIIFGSYEFKQTPPWLDNQITELEADSLNSVIKPYLKTIMEKQVQRDSLFKGYNGSQ